MESLTNTWKDLEDNVCRCCGKPTENYVRITEEGWCSQTYTAYVCHNHLKYFEINDQVFIKVGSELFHSFNEDYGIYNSLLLVRSKEHYLSIKNRKEQEFLSSVEFNE